MDGRFGVKDFLLFVLLAVVGVMVFLAMVQEDRRWIEMRDLRNAVDEQTRTLAQLRRTLERIETAPPVVVSNAPASQRVSPGASDDSWARDTEDPVVRLPPYRFPNDPRDEPDFSPGGEFVEMFEAQFPKITPFLYADVYARRIIEEAVCEQLAQYDPETLEYVQGLAEAYQYDDEGMWLRVKIHDRARFSDGEPVTADDVRFTINDFVFNPELTTERFRSTLNVIDRVEVVSDKVVDFIFTKPNFSNLDEALRFAIIPEHFYKDFTPEQLNTSTGLLLGSGPYRLENPDPNAQWTPGSGDLVLVRNEQYWGDARPFFDRKRYVVVDDNIARLTAFENGAGDMMRGTPDQYSRKSRDPEFTNKNFTLAWNNMRSGFAFVAWNCGQRNGRDTPFSDVRVRRAMAHLVDANRVVRDIYAGLGKPATGPFSSQTGQGAPDIVPIQQDIDRAKQLLAEAGWVDDDGNGVLEYNGQGAIDWPIGSEFVWEFTHSAGSSAGPKTAVYLKDQCAKVGIKVDVRILDWAVYFQTMDSRDFDAITLQWSWSKPESDPYQLWHSNSIANQGDNFAQYRNPEVDRLIEEGRRTLDKEARFKIWHELNRILYRDQPYLFANEVPWIRFVSKRIGNVHTYARGLAIEEMFAPIP